MVGSQGATAQGSVGSRQLALPAAVALLFLSACSQPLGGDAGTDSGGTSISLHGRVVNFESCNSGNGCGPVEGLQVSLRTLSDYISAPTEAPGRFELDVPHTYEDDLLVEPGAYPFAPTINPWAAPPSVADVYGIELFAMPVGTNRDGSSTILTALSLLTPPIHLADSGGVSGQGGYIGQVLRRTEEEQLAVLGARVTITLPFGWPPSVPAPEVLYVNNMPRYAEGDLLYEPGYPATGPFGIFIIPTAAQTAMITIHVETDDTVFNDVVANVTPGMVTFGIHRP